MLTLNSTGVAHSIAGEILKDGNFNISINLYRMDVKFNP